MKTKAPTPQSCLLGLLAAFGHTASSDKETASQMVPTVWLLFRPLIGPQNSPGYAKTVKSLQCYFLQVRGKSEINSQGWRKNWSNWSFFFLLGGSTAEPFSAWQLLLSLQQSPCLLRCLPPWITPGSPEVTRAAAQFTAVVYLLQGEKKEILSLVASTSGYLEKNKQKANTKYKVLKIL